jgi:hypothetical protein
MAAEAIPVRGETNSLRVHDILDMSLPRAMTGFAVRVVTRSGLVAMARVTVVRSKQVVCAIDCSRAPIAFLVGSCHHPGACEEQDEQAQGNSAPSDRPGRPRSVGPLLERPFSIAGVSAQSPATPHSLAKAAPVASPRKLEPSAYIRVECFEGGAIELHVIRGGRAVVTG